MNDDDDLPINEWLEAYDNDEYQAREDLINSIIDDLLDKYNYDGDYEDYKAIYYFIKCVKIADDQWESLMNIQSQPLIKQLHILHAPKHLYPTKRYDQSDEYINRINKEKDDALFNDLLK